ncbi:MAG: membrane protein [Anaerolineaceae bacterium]|nr:MAG: CBS domain-containing protein [Chloroflexota bacterium]GJQ34982.1 MAG: membrane protein [Anaerolineaceae bacterium]
MKVQDIMIRDVISICVDTTVDEIAKVLNEHRIGGAPVVDKERRVIGIVCESDLFLREKGLPFSAVKIPTLFKRWVDPDRLAEIYEGARHHTAADVMTTNVVCVDVDDTVGHAALLMVQRNIKRIPVLQDGMLVGIITRTDIIRLLARDEE